MNTPETQNSNPRSLLMRNHQFSFRVSKQQNNKQQHPTNKSPEEEHNRRLGFIRNGSLRRLLEGKHNNNEDIDRDHPERGFQMHKHHKLTIRSYLGSSPPEHHEESSPEEESKEYHLGVYERLYPEKESSSVNKPHHVLEEEHKEEWTANVSPLSPFSNARTREIHTIDEMPIPMKTSKRNLFDNDNDDEKEKRFNNPRCVVEEHKEEEEEETTAPDACRPLSAFSSYGGRREIHTIDEMPIPMKQSKRNLFVDNDEEEEKVDTMNNNEEELLSSLEYGGSISAPDIRKPLPPRRTMMKRRHSVTKFSESLLNAHLEAASQ